MRQSARLNIVSLERSSCRMLSRWPHVYRFTVCRSYMVHCWERMCFKYAGVRVAVGVDRSSPGSAARAHWPALIVWSCCARAPCPGSDDAFSQQNLLRSRHPNPHKTEKKTLRSSFRASDAALQARPCVPESQRWPVRVCYGGFLGLESSRRSINDVLFSSSASFSRRARAKYFLFSTKAVVFALSGEWESQLTTTSTITKLGSLSSHTNPRGLLAFCATGCDWLQSPRLRH